jgi:NAD(P)-dependent dehydrogenase (short-subunit alcohol dehydrogenase family)
MTRISVVTGAGSGIGRATVQLLRSRGEQVIGVDLRGADILADLSTNEGVTAMANAVAQAAGGPIDAVYAVAGLAEDTEATIAINFFGMTATLTQLRPLLLGSPAPRAVGVASMASLFPVDDPLLAALAAEDRPAALARARQLVGQGLIYGTSKQAFAKWVRRQAATADWAGASIPLNAVAPGIIRTAMTAGLMATDQATEQLLQQVPMPLNGVAEPEAVAELLAWLGSPANTHLCGQVVFIDGGSDVVIRGDAVW